MKTQKKNIHNKKQNRIMPLILLGGFIIAFSTQIFFNANSSNIKNINRNEVILNPPTAASTVVNTVFINGSDANNDWDDNVFVSQGSGSEISPYIIKDLVINVQGNGSGIEIINSDVHVIIQNCSITNSSQNIGSAGITITNSSNITIDNCSIFDNGLYGIHLSSSNSNTISSNNINANTRGILIYNSSNTIASHNNLTNNENYGIASASNSKNSSILWNSINDNGDGINIQSPLFNNITGNKISGNLNGISLNADNVSIDNNIISKNIEMGIALWSSNHTIINNIISENGDCGIFSLLYSVDNMIISNNTFINNNNDDIFIFKLVNSTLKGNTFTFGGLYLVIADNLDLDHSNTLNGRPIHYYEDVIGLNIDGENLGQLILINCSFSTFQNLEISNVKTGIYLMQSTNITLYHNTITNTSKYGIFVAGSINITLRSNILNFSGIKLAFSTEFSIDESNLINGKYFKYYKDQNDVVLDGNIDNIGQLVLENCTNFIIKNLVIANTSYGIQLIDSDNNELK